MFYVISYSRQADFIDRIYTANRRFDFGVIFGAFRNFAKSDYQFFHVRLPVHLSVRREHLGSHWTDFDEI